MKIYEIGTGYTPIPAKMGAATEIVVEELTKSFQKKGEDVTILDIKADDRLSNKLPIIEVSVPNKFTSTDVQLGIMHKLKRVVYSISLAQSLKKILKRSNEKVVLHFHNQYNMFFFLKLTSEKLRRKCFIAYTNHSYIWHGDWKEIEQTVQKRYFQEIYSMRHADKIYVLNEITRNTLVEHLDISEEKIVMIDNGVNTDIYSPLSLNEKEKVKKDLGLEGKKVYIQIGSVCERKNQLGSIKLLLPILKEDSNKMFVYAGGIISEEYQEEISKFAKENGIEKQIKYLGELAPGSGLNKCYNIADAMVFPSTSEGFSLVIIEAMSAGVPVVINSNLQFKLSDACLKFSDEQNFLELFKNNILDDEKQKINSEMARRNVVESYSWDKVAQDYYETWNVESI